MGIAAAATLGVAMLTSTTALAGPGKPGVLKPGVIGQLKPIGIKPKPWPGKPPGIKPWPKPKPHWHIHVHRRHIWYAAPAVSYAAARPAVAGPCTCLQKQYTPEGAVLFKDRCTNEMAMNPPAQQTGALDQQQQTGYPQQYAQPQPQTMQPQVSQVPQYPPQAPVAR